MQKLLRLIRPRADVFAEEELPVAHVQLVGILGVVGVSPHMDFDGEVLAEFVQAVLQTAKGKPQPSLRTEAWRDRSP
jgi:hypothetical protein